MYSRKFNGIGVLPPDYSGVALRRPLAIDPSDADQCTQPHLPHHPVFEKDLSSEAEECISQKGATYCPPQSAPVHRERSSQKEGSLLLGSFSAEDIMLAGLLLLLMNDENTDNNLLMILGLLLLAGS